ncbi:MAG: hypothetical protein ACXVEF_07900 [Polyangiales bacterium]
MRLHSFLFLIVISGCGGRVEDPPTPVVSPGGTSGSSGSSGSSESSGSGSTGTGSASPASPGSTSSTCTGVATSDFEIESMADTICSNERASGKDCKVCVQDIDERGVAVAWMVLEVADDCPCPKPGFRSTAAIDGGPPPPETDGGGFDLGFE